MSKTINDKSQLHQFYTDPKGASLEKTQYRQDEHSRRFNAASPFLILGTHGDVSPRGDPPGFVKVLDDNTLIIPDRKGNNRFDSMSNILADPTVALIFLIPGINEAFGIWGEVEITNDPILLEPLTINKQNPNSGLLIQVREAYIHCAKAILRSNLWEHEAKQGRLKDEYNTSYEDDIKNATVEEGREYNK